MKITSTTKKEQAEQIREEFNDYALKAEDSDDPIERALHMFNALRILRSIENEPVRPILYDAMIQYSTTRFDEFSKEAIRIVTSQSISNLDYHHLGGGQWSSREHFINDCRIRAPQLLEAWPSEIPQPTSEEEEKSHLKEPKIIQLPPPVKETQDAACQTDIAPRPSVRSLCDMVGHRQLPPAAESRRELSSRTHNIQFEEENHIGYDQVQARSMPKFRIPAPVNKGRGNNSTTQSRKIVARGQELTSQKGSNSRQPSKQNHPKLPREEKKEMDTKDSAEDELPERLKGCEPELIKRIENEIMEQGRSITFDDVAGLDAAKRSITELVIWPMRRPELFVGLRALPRGMLLFGPPGTGKTMIGRAIASSCGATFFAISASSLTSKWIGESEKLVRTLFAVAGYKEPSVVFVDEVDSLLSQRSAEENESSRRLKTEFLVQLEGVDTSKSDERVLIVGATNKPNELDEAARRRFVKRFYVPLPDNAARQILFRVLLKNNDHALQAADFDALVQATAGFSGADIRNLAQEASMGPVRDLGPALFSAPDTSSIKIPPITLHHFEAGLAVTRATVAPSEISFYENWDKQFGTAAPAPLTSNPAPSSNLRDNSTSSNIPDIHTLHLRQLRDSALSRILTPHSNF